MPFRSPKMYGFILGFQRLVWWPKCTPASSSSFVAIPGKIPPPRLTLAELEALARPSQTVLLPFLHTRIRRQQPVFLQQLAVVGVERDQRAGDAQAHRAGLPVDAAAGHRGQHVELFSRLGDRERPLDLGAKRLGREEVLELAMVDGDGAGSGTKEDARGRRLAATCCVMFSTGQAIRPRWTWVAAPRGDDPPSRRP